MRSNTFNFVSCFYNCIVIVPNVPIIMRENVAGLVHCLCNSFVQSKYFTTLSSFFWASLVSFNTVTFISKHYRTFLQLLWWPAYDSCSSEFGNFIKWPLWSIFSSLCASNLLSFYHYYYHSSDELLYLRSNKEYFYL